MGLSKFSPEIVGEINSLKGEITLLAHESRILAEHFNSHIPLIQEATKSLRDDIEVKKETLLTLKSIRDSHVAVGGLISQPFPPANLEVEGGAVPNTASSSSRPSTISKSDMVEGSKAYRLFRARQLLEQFGWGDSRW
jgi:hypothetical protein